MTLPASPVSSSAQSLEAQSLAQFHGAEERFRGINNWIREIAEYVIELESANAELKKANTELRAENSKLRAALCLNCVIVADEKLEDGEHVRTYDGIKYRFPCKVYEALMNRAKR